MSDVTKELMDLAARTFNVSAESLHAEDDFFTVLNIESIQALELLSELEMHFNVEIPDYELQGVVTFSGLASLIEKRI